MITGYSVRYQPPISYNKINFKWFKFKYKRNHKYNRRKCKHVYFRLEKHDTKGQKVDGPM